MAASRLVTLTGSAGVGKSRLAAHVAAEADRAFPDGVWVVEFGNVRDPSLFALQVAVALDLRDHSLRDVATVIADYLAGKNALLVLDDCEHLLQACSDFVDGLLPAAPRVHIMMTSREPLRSAAELVWPVPPLSLPAQGEPVSTSQHEAVQLFEERGADSRPGFTVNADNVAAVACLCRRLDGLPLAIELAAVRLRELSPDEILARLDNRFRLLTEAGPSTPDRHQTLRAAVDWSFDLCSEIERTVWARCSVFSGDFDLEAAENVCAGEGLCAGDVFTAVSGLVDKSVLTRSDGGFLVCYRMLETIREYGDERLAAGGTRAVLQRRHRDHYLSVVEQADKDATGPRHARLIDETISQRENLIAALNYCFDTPGEACGALRMAASLWFCWIGAGFLRSGRYWLDRALAEAREPSPERARALWINGRIAFLQGDHAASRDLWREGRTIAESIGDEETLTHVMAAIGAERMWAGELKYGAELLDTALARYRACGRWTALSLLTFSARAQAASVVGDMDLVLSLLDECRSLCEPLGERWALSWMEWMVGVGWWSVGRPAEAVGYLRNSLRDAAELRDKLGVACGIEVLAWAAVAEGDARRGAVLFGAVATSWEPLGRPLFGVDHLLAWSRKQFAAARAHLGDRAFELAVGEGQTMSSGEVVAYALGRQVEAAPTKPKTVLTKRERDVADLVAEGLSNKGIASRLVISPRTVESHLDRILSKLGFTSRTQIAVWVAERDR